MLYGEAKRRTMARSVLPSSARKGAANDLHIAARMSRRVTRQAIRALSARSIDLLDDEIDQTLSNVEGRRRGTVAFYVEHRRTHDKLAPFERWAPAATAHLDLADRLPTLRSWLPPGVIGWHAMGHVRRLDGLDPGWCHRPGWRE